MKITIAQKGQKLVTVPFQIIKFQNLKSFFLLRFFTWSFFYALIQVSLSIPKITIGNFCKPFMMSKLFHFELSL